MVPFKIEGIVEAFVQSVITVFSFGKIVVSITSTVIIIYSWLRLIEWNNDAFVDVDLYVAVGHG
jgi:hypothetical protein